MWISRAAVSDLLLSPSQAIWYRIFRNNYSGWNHRLYVLRPLVETLSIIPWLHFVHNVAYPTWLEWEYYITILRIFGVFLNHRFLIPNQTSILFDISNLNVTDFYVTLHETTIAFFSPRRDGCCLLLVRYIRPSVELPWVVIIPSLEGILIIKNPSVGGGQKRPSRRGCFSTIPLYCF